MEKKIRNKRSAYLGAGIVAVGILFNKVTIEATLVPDKQIELPGYIALIYLFQLLAIVSGTYLLVKQPEVRLPKKSDIALVLFSTLMTFFLLEVAARVWLSYLATPEQYDRYVLFTSLDANQYAWTPHPYLAYYPTP
ncbi:MAG: hypothetical protein AB1649_25455, partial [Chloroflexota bacterium]